MEARTSGHINCWIQAPKSRQTSATDLRVARYVNRLALANTVRQIVHHVAPQVPVADMTTQSRRIDGPDRLQS